MLPSLTDKTAIRLNALNAVSVPEKATFSLRTVSTDALVWGPPGVAGFDSSRWLHHNTPSAPKPSILSLYVVAQLTWASLFEDGEPADTPRIGFKPILQEDAISLRTIINTFTEAPCTFHFLLLLPWIPMTFLQTTFQTTVSSSPVA